MKNHHTVDLKAIAINAMRKYGFEPLFPNSVVREVASIPLKNAIACDGKYPRSAKTDPFNGYIDFEYRGTIRN